MRWIDQGGIDKFHFYIRIIKITCYKSKNNTAKDKELKIVYLFYEQENSFAISYKYRNANVHVCQKLDLRKRQLKLISMARPMSLLYQQ